MPPAKSAQAVEPPRADLVTAEPSALHTDFANWIQEQTGYKPDLKTVQVVTVLRMAFQRSETNQNRRLNAVSAKEQAEAERLQRAEEREAERVRKAEEKEQARAAREAERTEKAAAKKAAADEVAAKRAAKAQQAAPAAKATAKTAPAAAKAAKPRAKAAAAGGGESPF